MSNVVAQQPMKIPITADICALAPSYDTHEKAQKIQTLAQLLEQTNSVLVAHYYVDEAIQELAEQSGGFVGDSLEMAQFGKKHSATHLMVAGVRFMGETAKILSPDKRVFMPTLSATCSLDESCPIDLFDSFCNQHPERTVVVYANTSAAVKARADWVVTSSIALKVVSHLMDRNQQILWAPDKYLGQYIQRTTGADMLLWKGSCVVHEEFKFKGLSALKQRYPNAAVLVHPEAPHAVIEQADVVGSTSALIKAVQDLDNPQFIVATDNRIFYKMRQFAGDKELIEAPTAGEGATCHSCAHCPWMAMNNLDNLERAIVEQHNEILIDDDIRKKAFIPTSRMINFSLNDL